MALVSPRTGGILAVTSAVVALGVVLLTEGGATTAVPSGEVVAAERGEVAVTVGGIGHVSTLTGAARLSVPGAAGGGGLAAGTSTASSKGPPASSSSAAGSQIPADAVFPAVAGHVSRVLVKAGQTVVAGQPIATLSDDGTSEGAVLQARSDLSTAQLELAQKRVQDPLRGQPPTPSELVSARQAVLSARAKLGKVLGPPLPSEVATARSDLAKARADLRASRTGAPSAIAAAELGVATAQRKLETLTGAPDPVELANAQLEVAKATLDQEALLRPAAGPSPLAVKAADLAIQAGQQHVASAQAAGNATELATAQAELAKAHSERDALSQAPAGPSDAARGAAQLAVDAARQKLGAVLHPSATAVSAARTDLAKAEAELATLRATRTTAGLAGARAVVAAARAKLTQVLGPPTPDVVPAARLDLRKAQADLAVMRQRGAPASARDLALARLKVDVASQRVALARQLTARLTVLASSSGTVTSVLTTQGAAVDGATPVARVQDLAHLVVALDLSEFDVGRTRIGAPARIGVDALGGRQFGGHVLDVALSGNDTGGVVSFPVVIALNRPGRLRPGMSVSARIVVTSHPDVVRIPLAAVSGGSHVLVHERSGAFRRRRVQLGLAGAEFVEVRSGVREGEGVLVPTSGG